MTDADKRLQDAADAVLKDLEGDSDYPDSDGCAKWELLEELRAALTEARER